VPLKLLEIVTDYALALTLFLFVLLYIMVIGYGLVNVLTDDLTYCMVGSMSVCVSSRLASER